MKKSYKKELISGKKSHKEWQTNEKKSQTSKKKSQKVTN